MHRKTQRNLIGALTCLTLLFLVSCGFSSSNTIPAVATTVTSGTGQSAPAGKAFAAPLVVTVTTRGLPMSGVQVTFTAPSSGASGTFANGTNTETDTTDAHGVAASSVFTANKTPGAYIVTASVSGASPVIFTLTNASGSTTNYSFYLSGLEANSRTDSYYALAGAVSIDSTGAVVGGEQDYNDAAGLTSPASGDSISGGLLTRDVNGQGTLTLVTNNPQVGVGGTETLAVQFVNANHALITQFDGSATSSGSMDLQTATSASDGNYAFTLSGVDPSYNPVAFGGVFAISGTSLSNGLFDVNDVGTVVKGTAFGGTLSTPDPFGRGTITGTGMVTTIVYYIVGQKAIRLIDVDTTTTAVGSAFSQGSGTFTNASLGSSVFSLNDNPYGVAYAAAGMFTVPAGGTFAGIADADDQGWVVWSGAPISGNYSISNTVSGTTYNGYGRLTITNAGLGDPSLAVYLTTLGIYMTDPTVNLNDPNNGTGGGGALTVALDPPLAGGAGVVIPQTDTATASFVGNYGFGGQDYYTGNPGWEFDFVGQGSVAASVLSGSGLVSDPLGFFTSNPADYTAVPFSGTATPDSVNAGRYTMTLNITVAGSPVPFQTVIYQASGGQLFWLDEDNSGLFLGSLQQQGSLAGLPAARKAAAKTQVKRRH